MRSTFLVAAIGLVLGVLGAKVLFVGSGISLVLWAVIGMAIGYRSRSCRRSVSEGTAYGFVLAASFMVTGYDGTASVATRIPFFLALGVVGAIGGVVVAYIGARLHAPRTQTDRSVMGH